MRKLFHRIFLTFSAVLMSPMLSDDPKSTPESRKKMFWQGIKAIWKGELDD
jgi:hypothetical protein